tara:strand:- start:286 stop:573 length:288 start_codon:yes stop_codon:yes gene_type:complete
MTIQEIMERSGLSEETLAIAYIRDALNLINSSTDEDTKSWYRDIIKGSSTVDNYYPFPPDMIKLRSISVKDTNDDKYKKIRRLVSEPAVIEDVSP